MAEFIVLLAGFFPALGGLSDSRPASNPPMIYCTSKRIEYYDNNAKLMSASSITNDIWLQYCSGFKGRRAS